jgi:hypothetical protein
MNSTLTAAIAGERIAGLTRDSYQRQLARETQAAWRATHTHGPSWLATHLLPARWRQLAA